MNDNQKSQKQLQPSQLSADDLILLHLIEHLSDESFAARYSSANNLSKQSPEYRPVH